MQYKIIVDKQPSSNPSDEKKEYIIDIEELRVKGNVYDSLNIELNRTYVTRRLSLSEYGVLTVLDKPIIEDLDEIDIELFEGDNYIYLSDMQGNKFYVEYLIKNDFNDIYATKNEMNSAITQTAQSIELSVNQKLEGYEDIVEGYGKLEINKEENEDFEKVEINIVNDIANNTNTLSVVINEKSYEFNLGDVSYSFVGDKFNYDKIELVKVSDTTYKVIITKQAKLNNIGIIVGDNPREIYNQEIEISFQNGNNLIYLREFENSKIILNRKKDGYATIYEMNSVIKQTANEINLEVSKKVNDEELTGANIALRINEDDSSEAVIQADKININGAISANGNFKVDTKGNMICNNGTFNGGKVDLIGGTEESSFLNVFKNSNKKNTERFYATNNRFGIWDNTYRNITAQADDIFTNLTIQDDKDTYITNTVTNSFPSTTWHGKNSSTQVDNQQIRTPKLTQTSLAEQKKNFKRMKDNAIDIIKNIDIYNYNLKSEKDTDKKHIGFVIGEGYNYSKEVTSENNDGVDIYSFTSLCCKAIQEQQKIIEQLQKDVEELKEVKDG